MRTARLAASLLAAWTAFWQVMDTVAIPEATSRFDCHVRRHCHHPAHTTPWRTP